MSRITWTQAHEPMLKELERKKELHKMVIRYNEDKIIFYNNQIKAIKKDLEEVK